jgi:two-component system, chemotaxis family, protein-glutamate methylesterase/glutaminase
MTSIKYVEPPPPGKDPADPVLPWLVVAGAAGAQGARQLAAFVAALPGDLPAAVLISLHGPPEDGEALFKTLRRVSRLPVVTAFEAEPVHSGVCYLADRNHHLAVAGVGAHLVRGPVARGRTVDMLFKAAATAGGARVAGVVLAGATRDGASGLAEIVRHGGVGLAIEGRDACQALTARSPQALADLVVQAVRERR